MRTLVHSWVPNGGPIIGMVVRHAESFTISDHLTVWEETIEGRRAVYRPTVHYAYMPCNHAILGLHELGMRNFQLQPRLRIMTDEITEGIDELGVLLMGHGLNAWWTGSQLDIHETRQLVPRQNATTLQVAAGVCRRRGLDIGTPSRASSCPTTSPTARFSRSPARTLAVSVGADGLDSASKPDRSSRSGDTGGDRSRPLAIRQLRGGGMNGMSTLTLERVDAGAIAGAACRARDRRGARLAAAISRCNRPVRDDHRRAGDPRADHR